MGPGTEGWGLGAWCLGPDLGLGVGFLNFSKCQKHQKCFLVILNVCVSLLVACCCLHENENKMSKNKREEQQQGKKNNEQEENTYIRRRTTNKKTVHVIKTIEREEHVRNNTKQESREEQTEETL